MENGKLFEKIAERLNNAEELTLNISRIMKRSVMRNFATESDGKRRWARLAHSTLKQRRKKGYTGKILQRTGQLKNSIQTAHDKNSATVYTNLIYAGVQNYGAVIHRSSLKSFLTKKRKGKNPKRPRQNRMSSFRIPARPFLTLRENQFKQIENEIAKWIRGNN